MGSLVSLGVPSFEDPALEALEGISGRPGPGLCGSWPRSRRRACLWIWTRSEYSELALFNRLWDVVEALNFQPCVHSSRFAAHGLLRAEEISDEDVRAHAVHVIRTEAEGSTTDEASGLSDGGGGLFSD
ncbi:MAG: hypothetical protein VYC95_00585 [Verrucomicrobiota bacterium]|nr:hypothetical protein [Verrucomicrobiota bacterium]